MKIIYLLFTTALFLLSSSPVFAEWLDAKKIIRENMTEEEIETFIFNHNKEFILTGIQPKIGVKIFARDYNSSVLLRHVNNKLDFKVSFYDALFESAGKVYLEILDEDGLRIDSIFLGGAGEYFSGDILGGVSMKYSVFKKIKYYYISMYCD